MLSELEAGTGPTGLPIERALYFEPAPFSKVIERRRQQHGGAHV